MRRHIGLPVICAMLSVAVSLASAQQARAHFISRRQNHQLRQGATAIAAGAMI